MVTPLISGRTAYSFKSLETRRSRVRPPSPARLISATADKWTTVLQRCALRTADIHSLLGTTQLQASGTDIFPAMAGVDGCTPLLR